MTPAPHATEDALHLAVAETLTWAIAPPGHSSIYAVCWFSVEHRNAQSRVEGAKRKARGVVAGIPDLWVFHDRRVLPIELKRHDGVVSKDQVKLHATLAGSGVATEVCRSVDEVLEHLREMGVPMRIRVAA